MLPQIRNGDITSRGTSDCRNRYCTLLISTADASTFGVPSRWLSLAQVSIACFVCVYLRYQAQDIRNRTKCNKTYSYNHGILHIDVLIVEFQSHINTPPASLTRCHSSGVRFGGCVGGSSRTSKPAVGGVWLPSLACTWRRDEPSNKHTSHHRVHIFNIGRSLEFNTLRTYSLLLTNSN